MVGRPVLEMRSAEFPCMLYISFKSYQTHWRDSEALVFCQVGVGISRCPSVPNAVEAIDATAITQFNPSMILVKLESERLTVRELHGLPVVSVYVEV